MKVLALLFALTLFLHTSANKKVVCYWATWAAYRRHDARFTIDKINPKLCTHIIYSFLGANDDGTWKSNDPNLDLTHKKYLAKFSNLKSVNSKVKLMASIGGGKMGGSLFGRIASNPNTRARFAHSVLQLLKLYNFDGFDLDWEFPKSHEKAIFVDLLKELKSKLKPAGKLLTIAVGATAWRIGISYDIKNIFPHVDFINLMTYDMHGSWSKKTGINAPLFAKDHLSVNDGVNFWLARGCPREKLVVGVPFYGRSFTVVPGYYIIGAPATVGRAGKFIPKAKGILPFYEICLNVKRGGWTRKFPQLERAPYAYKGDQWVGYDDLESIKYKLNYIVGKQLGGAMFWSIDMDDFGNICGDGKFPLLSLAHRVLRGDYNEGEHNRTRIFNDDEESEIDGPLDLDEGAEDVTVLDSRNEVLFKNLLFIIISLYLS